MLATDYPNILIVSEPPFCRFCGGGSTLISFFEEWPKDKLFQFYALGRIIYWNFEIANDICENILCITTPEKGRYYNTVNAIKFLYGLIPRWRNRYSKKWLKRVLKNWYPSVVYSFVYMEESLRYAAWLAKEFRCPHVTHLSDPLDNKSLDSHEQKWRGLKNLFHEAKIRLVVSEETRLEYEKYYGINFRVLYRGVDDELLEPLKTTSVLSRDILIIRYLGGIDKYRHFNAIEDVVEAVKDFNRSIGPARFEIYGGGENWKANALSLANSKEIFYGGDVTKSEGHELLKTADILIVPVNFNSLDFVGVRLGLPVKVPEYLGSGTPTLIYGPSGTAAVEYCRRNNLGLIQTKRDISALIELFARIKNNKETFRFKASCDQAFIKKHCSASMVRNRFYDIIKEALA
jgi:glycosyltransferase involved in cell wall biosynthesis